MEDNPIMDNPFMCNRCLCNIGEFRYKCLQCADFDLCAECLVSPEPCEAHDPATHALIKLSVNLPHREEEQPDDADALAEDPVRELHNTLLVLDGVHHLGLDTDALAAHCKMPHAKVRAIIDE